MSLAINPDNVVAVLLADGLGWHEVAGDSFDLDSYEFIEPHPNPDRDGLVLHGGGQSGVCATGFAFMDTGGDWLCGPLTAVLAVRCQPHPCRTETE